MVCKRKGIGDGVGKQEPIDHVKKSTFYFKGNGEPMVVSEYTSNQMLKYVCVCVCVYISIYLSIYIYI